MIIRLQRQSTICPLLMLSQSLHFLLCTTLCLVSTCTKLWLCPSHIFKQIFNNKTTRKTTRTRTATTNSQPESTLSLVLSIQWSSEVKFGMNLDKSHCLPPEKNCGPSFPFSTLRDSKVVRYIRQNLTESTTDLPVLFKFGQSAA